MHHGTLFPSSVVHFKIADFVTMNDEGLSLTFLINMYTLFKRCSHCRDLHPTWETLAELMTDVAENIIKSQEHTYSEDEYGHAMKVELPVMVAKVDCVHHQQFCRSQMIMAYPTLRLFVDGERWRGGDYRGHRTVAEMADYLKQVEDLHKTDTNSNKAKNVELAHRGTCEHLFLFIYLLLFLLAQR